MHIATKICYYYCWIPYLLTFWFYSFSLIFYRRESTDKECREAGSVDKWYSRQRVLDYNLWLQQFSSFTSEFYQAARGVEPHVISSFFKFLWRRPHRAYALCIDDRWLSVRLSVLCLTLPREHKGIESWKLTGVCRKCIFLFMRWKT